MEDVRDRLNAEINISGLRRRIVAERAHLTPQQLSDITSKRRRLDANEMLDLCAAIGITPNDLFPERYLEEQDKRPRTKQ